MLPHVMINVLFLQYRQRRLIDKDKHPAHHTQASTMEVVKSEETPRMNQWQRKSTMAVRTAQIMGVLIISLMITLSYPLPAYASDISRLGYRWDVTVPGGWTGIWTRRDISGAISNQYDAFWSYVRYHPL
jgi:hypothetical protein